MILKDTVNDVVVKGVNETSEFTIKTSTKAFKILSQGLYSNPIGAVVRELSTNAYDAHVTAGCKERPFKIKLPTTLCPEFSIRDYGTGLCHEDVMSIYSTFFESTKTNSNDVVGCLGLGSKSPFAITNSFFVISYFNGVKSVYSLYIDKNYIPNISLFGSEDTDEENGLQIDIAVKKDDMEYFDYEVKEQLRHFEVKPIIEGNKDFYFHNDVVALSGNGWKLGNYLDSYAVQGQIAYPIDQRLMSQKYNFTKGMVFNSHLLSGRVAIDFPIGSIDIAPSREAINYDDNTIKIIGDRIEEVAKEIEQAFIEKINSADNRWNAVKFYKAFKSKFYNIIGSTIPESIIYNLDDFIRIDNISTVNKYYRKSPKTIGKYSTNTIKISDNQILIRVTSSDKKNIDFQLKSLVKDKGQIVYAIHTDLSHEDINKILEANEQIIDFSELTYKRISNARVANPKSDYVKSLSSHAYNKQNYWDRTIKESEVTDEYFYVETDRYDYVCNNHKYNPEGLVVFIEVFRAMTGFNKVILGLSGRQILKTKAKPFFEYLTTFVKNKVVYDLPYTSSKIYSAEILAFAEHGSIYDKIKKLHELKKQNRFFNDYIITKFLKKMNITTKVVTIEMKDYTDVFEKYKMLDQMSFSSSHIKKIIKILDHCHKTGLDVNTI